MPAVCTARPPRSPARRTRCEQLDAATVADRGQGVPGGGRSHPLALLLRGELHKLDKPPGSRAALPHQLAGQRGRAARAGAGGGTRDGLALPRGFPHRCHLGDGLGVRRNAPAPASGHECILRAPSPRLTPASEWPGAGESAAEPHRLKGREWAGSWGLQPWASTRGSARAAACPVACGPPSPAPGPSVDQMGEE